MALDDFETRRERQKQGIELAKRDGKYAGRPVNTVIHDKIVLLRSKKHSIAKTAKLAGCSESQVKRVWAIHKNSSFGRT